MFAEFAILDETMECATHLRRVAIAHPKNYHLTFFWIANMLCTFWFFLLAKMINTNILNNIIGGEDIIAKNNTENLICRRYTNSSFSSSSSTFVEEEPFVNYRTRWLDEVVYHFEKIHCDNNVSLTVGGKQNNEYLQYDSFIFTPELMRGFDFDSEFYKFHLHQIFAEKCPDSHTCEQFLLLEQTSTSGSLFAGTPLQIDLQYDVMIEHEWDTSAATHCFTKPSRQTMLLVTSTIENPLVFGLVTVAAPLAAIAALLGCSILFPRWLTADNLYHLHAVWLAVLASSMVLIAISCTYLSYTHNGLYMLMFLGIVNLCFVGNAVRRYVLMELMTRFFGNDGDYYSEDLEETFNKISTSNTTNNMATNEKQQQQAQQQQQQRKQLIERSTSSWLRQLDGNDIPSCFFINNWEGTRLLSYAVCVFYLLSHGFQLLTSIVTMKTDPANKDSMRHFFTFSQFRVCFSFYTLLLAPIGWEAFAHLGQFDCLPLPPFFVLVCLLLYTTLGITPTSILAQATNIYHLLGEVSSLITLKSNNNKTLVNFLFSPPILGIVFLNLIVLIMINCKKEHEVKNLKVLFIGFFKNQLK